VCYVPIEVEEVQNLSKIFREAIGNNGNRTLKLVGLLVEVGCKDCLMWQLVELPKISRLIGGKQPFKST
jgi:hypothetical protein